MKVNDYFKYINIGLPEDIRRLKEAGYYKEAERVMDVRAAMASTPDELKWCFLAWKEIFRRIPREYPFTFEEVLTKIRERIPDFTEEDLRKEEDAGLLRWIFIDGEKRYLKSCVRTILKIDLDAAERAGIGKGDPDGKLLNDAMAECKANGSISRNIKFTASLKVKDEKFTKGMKVKVHIPIPADCIEQSDIEILSTSPANALINEPDAPARCVFFEEVMNENHEFSVTYRYKFTNVYHDAYEKAAALSDTAPNVDYNPGEEFLKEEAPHIVFSPVIKALAADITKGCTNKTVMAKKIYDYLTLNLRYTYNPNYILLTNMVEEAALNMRCDCGLMSLLFITICRAAGVAARWQSGRRMESEYTGEHDWSEVYLEGYGWIPVDISYGVAAHRYGNEERRQFYFGNYDPYRLVAATKFMADFTPEKDFFRNDPYDNQDGEMESDTTGFREDDIVENYRIEVS